MTQLHRFSKAKSYNFHFHKNDVTSVQISANGLLLVLLTLDCSLTKSRRFHAVFTFQRMKDRDQS